MTTLLFFDDWWLEAHHNVVRRMGKPTWIPDATLEDNLTKGIYNFPTVFRDPESMRWYALYQGVVGVSEEITTVPADVPVMMIAESEDGLHWKKPDLSEVIDQSNRVAPNQVLKHDDIYDRGPVFFDSKTQDPQGRLKAMCLYEHKGEDGRRVFTQRIAHSPEGIQWKVEDRIWNNWLCSDSPYPIFWNERRNLYTIMTRPQQAERRLVRIDTADFQTFDGPYNVLSPDPLDPPLVQFYGMPVFPYEGMFIGFLWLMYGDPYEIKLLKRNGPIDAQLTYSYDGIAFNRAFRKPFVSRNQRGEEGGGCIYPTSMVQDDNGDLLIYSGSSHGEHYKDTDQLEAALLVHKLRQDGFMYMESYSYTGRIMTRCLKLAEDLDLKLNVRAPYGWVRAQLSDVSGQPLNGYSFEECEPFRGDAYFWEPKWTSKKLSQLSEGVGRIEIELTNAELYAIRGNFKWMRTARVRNFRPDESQPNAVEVWENGQYASWLETI
jgi:hypothetical protein